MLKKKELLGKVAEKAKTTSKSVDAVIASLSEVVAEELKSGEKVVVKGLCSFTPKFVEGGKKSFRNPRTKETIVKVVPDKVTIKFKPDKSLLDVINAK